jgi:hypothetical protein
MEKAIFIHIGAHKTGTTAIQSFFALNRKKMKEIGILYPGSDNAHHEIAVELKDIKNNHDILDKNSNTIQIMWEIKKTNCPIIVLSSETFTEKLNPESLTEDSIAAEVKNVIEKVLGDSVKVKIILYCRRQDHQIQSVYQQLVKAPKYGICEPIREFLIQKKPYLIDRWNYWNKLKPWSENFGRENIIVKIFEKEQFYKGDLLSDFCNIIGLECTEVFQIPSNIQSNIGLDSDSIEIIRICNSVSNNQGFRRFVVNSLVEIGVKKIGDPYTLLSPQERIAILNTFEPSNQKVAREFLGRSDGRLFYAPLPDLQEPWKPYEGLTVEKFVPIFTQMLFNMDKKYQNQIENDIENRRLKRRMMLLIVKIGTRFGLLPTMKYWHNRLYRS